jgi:hypothetical protein
MYTDDAHPLALFVFSMHAVDGPELPTKASACRERFLHLRYEGGVASAAPDRDEAWEAAGDLLEAQEGIETMEVCWEKRLHAPVDSWVCFRFSLGGGEVRGEVRVSRQDYFNR